MREVLAQEMGIQVDDRLIIRPNVTVNRVLIRIHVNDNDGNQQQNAIPGEGTYDFPRLIRLLGEVGYTGFLSLELGWTYTFNPVPEVSEALRRMQDYLRG